MSFRGGLVALATMVVWSAIAFACLGPGLVAAQVWNGDPSLVRGLESRWKWDPENGRLALSVLVPPREAVREWVWEGKGWVEVSPGAVR